MTNEIAQLIALGFSAGSWLIAALISTPFPMAYLSGPPESVMRKIVWQSRFNAGGALFAAIAVVLQAYKVWHG